MPQAKDFKTRKVRRWWLRAYANVRVFLRIYFGTLGASTRFMLMHQEIHVFTFFINFLKKLVYRHVFWKVNPGILEERRVTLSLASPSYSLFFHIGQGKDYSRKILGKSYVYIILQIFYFISYHRIYCLFLKSTVNFFFLKKSWKEWTYFSLSISLRNKKSAYYFPVVIQHIGLQDTSFLLLELYKI